MKPGPVALAIVAASLMFMTIPLPVNSQEITGISANGTCRDFTVTVKAADLGESCWDVKLDVPGDVITEGKARSSFYYVEKAICYPDDSAEMIVRLETSEPEIDATAKLRQGSRVLERDFRITQSCPQPLPDQWVLLVAFVIVLIFGWTLTWWWKRK